MGKQKTLFRKGAALGLAVSLCILFFTACGMQKLSGDFDEAAVKSGAEEVIQLIGDKDSDKLREMSNVRLKTALTDDVLDQVYEAIGEGGAFKEIADMSVAGSKDRETEEEFAVVIAKAKYENRNFTYTISFTKQMKLAGLYYK